MPQRRSKKCSASYRSHQRTEGERVLPRFRKNQRRLVKAARLQVPLAISCRTEGVSVLPEEGDDVLAGGLRNVPSGVVSAYNASEVRRGVRGLEIEDRVRGGIAKVGATAHDAGHQELRARGSDVARSPTAADRARCDPGGNCAKGAVEANVPVRIGDTELGTGRLVQERKQAAAAWVAPDDIEVRGIGTDRDTHVGRLRSNLNWPNDITRRVTAFCCDALECKPDHLGGAAQVVRQRSSGAGTDGRRSDALTSTGLLVQPRMETEFPVAIRKVHDAVVAETIGVLTNHGEAAVAGVVGEDSAKLGSVTVVSPDAGTAGGVSRAGAGEPGAHTVASRVTVFAGLANQEEVDVVRRSAQAVAEGGDASARSDGPVGCVVVCSHYGAPSKPR